MTQSRNRSKPQSQTKPGTKKREDALKQALRANLQRRKSQARARKPDMSKSGGEN